MRDVSPSHPLTPDQIWFQVLRRPRGAPAPRPALFLDRDGVIVEEVDYLCRPDDVRLAPGAAAAIRAANLGGFPVVVVTNQSGLARGYFGWDDFAATQERILGDLATEGAYIDAVVACPHHAGGRPPFDLGGHPARKPGPGMLEMAANPLAIDLGRSWIVGDHATDIGAGRNAGLEGAVHVRTGHGAHDGQRERARAWARPGFTVLERPSIVEAAADIPFLAGCFSPPA